MIFRKEFRQKFLRLLVDECDIIRSIFQSILRSILARLGHELDAIDMLEPISQEYSDGPCSCIEVEENSSFGLHEITNHRVELLGSEGIGLEEAFRIDFECFSE